jgi:tetratricopeptide (TPR) repeat protein
MHSPMEKIQAADALMRQQEFSRAAVLAKEAAEEFPENSPDQAYAFYLLGVARMKCVRFHLAKEALEKADVILPRKPENLRTLGWVKVMLGDLEGGRKDIREAIHQNLMYALAYVDLAMSYIHYFDFEQGNEFLATAKSLAPDDAFVNASQDIAKDMENSFGHHSAKERERMRAEKLNPDLQREFRVALLEQFMQAHPMGTRQEVDEIAEELNRNGLKGVVQKVGEEAAQEHMLDDCPLCQQAKSMQRRKDNAE